jgi:CheY-like chemotaxis protein
MIAMLLGEHGFVVVQAENGDEATQIWQTRVFDAVITDLRMPGMSGVELVQRLRARSSQQQGVHQTLFIALSASTAIVSPLDTHGQSLFDTVLEKPIAVEKLVETLTRARRARPAAT